MYQIGIDIGGTNVKIGLLNEALELCAEISIPFPHTTAEDMAAQIRAAVGPMLQARGAALSDVESLGAVVPGSIDAAGETVVDAHNLNFHNVPLRKILSDAFPGIPVYIANDANGAALAELYTGAFVGCKTGVLLTLGTGLGGGIILNGKMFNGGMNHGVELGHAYLVDGGEPCTCGNLGCMEAYCAASALTRDGRRAMQAHPESMLAEQTGGDPGKITPKLVTDCAKAGDAAAKAVFDTYIEHLSSACASVYNILDPEVLAIGGGLSAAGPFLFDPLQEKVSEKCFYATRGKLVPAVLGNEAGMVGAALLARDLAYAGQDRGLAQVAAVGRVLREALDAQLVHLDDAPADAVLPAEGLCRGRVVCGGRSKRRRDREALLAKLPVRLVQEQRRVDAAGEGDGHAVHVGQNAPQLTQLVVLCVGRVEGDVAHAVPPSAAPLAAAFCVARDGTTHVSSPNPTIRCSSLPT